VAASLRALAWLHELREDFPAARKARVEVLASRKDRYGEKDWGTINAWLEVEGGDRLAQLTRAERGELERATAMSVQSRQLWLAGRVDEALRLGRQALAVREKLLGERHPACLLSGSSGLDWFWANLDDPLSPTDTLVDRAGNETVN
jgi:hypothetical protein